jgi:hypothetical protein
MPAGSAPRQSLAQPEQMSLRARPGGGIHTYRDPSKVPEVCVTPHRVAGMVAGFSPNSRCLREVYFGNLAGHDIERISYRWLDEFDGVAGECRLIATGKQMADFVLVA